MMLPLSREVTEAALLGLGHQSRKGPEKSNRLTAAGGRHLMNHCSIPPVGIRASV
jgi:hypothetical protein